MIVKENMHRQIALFDPTEGAIQFIKLFLGSDFDISDLRKSITETTAEVILDIKDKDDNLFCHFSMDNVPSIQLLFWPEQAEAWIARARLWLPHMTMQSIVVKGCQLVPRSSPGGDKNSEWRISFSGPEAILAQHCSKEQRRAYYFFKILFYRYLKGVEPLEADAKPLYSYFIKTTMLWTCENHSPDDPVWLSLDDSMQVLLSMLLRHLKSRFLPHYFIPQINLLERVGEWTISA